MTARESAPRTLELIYEPAPNGPGWVGSSGAFPDVREEGRSIHQVDLRLAPALSRAVATRYGEALAINVVPGGEQAIGYGRYRKIVRVVQASLSCTLREG